MSPSDENEEEEIKVILIGNTQVGKTSLINIAMGYGFNENEKGTSASYYRLKKLINNISIQLKSNQRSFLNYFIFLIIPSISSIYAFCFLY